MKPLDSDKKPAKPAETAPTAPAVEEKIDFSNVQIEPLFTDLVDFDTFSKSDDGYRLLRYVDLSRASRKR